MINVFESLLKAFQMPLKELSKSRFKGLSKTSLFPPLLVLILCCPLLKGFYDIPPKDSHYGQLRTNVSATALLARLGKIAEESQCEKTPEQGRGKAFLKLV